MTDGHIHIERGPYTTEWIGRFAEKAAEMRLSEIRLLEHNYMFEEFRPMYGGVCARNEYINEWFHRKACRHRLEEYLELIARARQKQYPVKILFGLEVDWLRGCDELIAEQTKNKGFDFLLGSIHYAGDFAFDHKAEHWAGIDVDSAYRAYFEDSVSLAGSGLFDGIGHPDSIRLFGHKPSFPLTEYYTRLAGALAENRMYADQNSGAERRCPDTCPLGMDRELLHLLKEYGVLVITSSDAHCPEDVGYKIPELEKRVAEA